MKKYIAFSGWVESTTMCLLYGKGATAIFTDTGAEHEEMYKRIDYVSKMLEIYHEGDFNVVKLRAKVKVPNSEKKVDSLLEYISEAKYLPNPQSRFCTRLFKIAIMDNYLKEQGNCELMIGLNSDEDDRVGNLSTLKNVKYTYPLKRDVINRDMCIEKLTQVGLQPNFPAYMIRGVFT